MSRTPIDQLIPRADKHIVRAFPRVAQRLESEVDDMDRGQMETFLKILPGAIERFQAVVTPVNDLHQSVEVAISQLVASFPRQSFGSQPASSDDPASRVDTRNTSLETGESVDGASGPKLPNGSDTSQANSGNSLPHSELAAAPGNTGESESLQADRPNPRVRKWGQRRGKRALARTQQASGESGNDRG